MAVLLACPVVAGDLYAHPDTPVSQLTEQQLKSILYLRQKTWDNDQRILVLVPQGNPPAFVNFIKSHIGLFPYQLRRHWDRSNFSGRAAPPSAFASDQDLIQALKTSPGAIGFVSTTLETRELKRVEIVR